MISQWYDPEQGSAAIPGGIARALVDGGHDVHVVTGYPNYPQGKLYEGYKISWRRTEMLAGVTVHRVPLLPSHDRSQVRRAANYLSFALAAISELRLMASCDVVLVYSTPATVAIPALVAKVLMRTPYVLLVQDLWPDTVVGSGLLGRSTPTLRVVLAVLERFCRRTYASASGIALTAPAMESVLAERGVPRHRLSVVTNWVDESLFRPVPKSEELAGTLGLRGAFVLMYAGSLGDVQGLHTVVQAVTHLRDLRDLQLVFVGTGVAEAGLRDLVIEQGLNNVKFLGQRSLEEMPALLAIGDLQLVCLRDLPLFRFTLPSKVQVLLACGRPVVASAAGDTAAVIEQAGAGLSAAPGDPAALAYLVRQLYQLPNEQRESMGRAGQRYYADHMSSRVGIRQLEGLLARAASGRRSK